MKKKFIQPQAKVEQTELESFICGSQGVISEQGINYGGVDDVGTKDPESRRRNNIWNDEDFY